jgi:hypothetical protein
MTKNILIVIIFLYTTILYSQIVYFDSKTQLYGIINNSGKIILNPKYEDMTAFQFGITRFKENDKWGIIDTNGKVIIKAQFDYCSFNRLGFNEGLISVNYNDKYGFFNLKGEMVIPFKYDFATDFCGGVAFVELDDKYNFINKNGNYLSEIWFDDVKIVNGVNYGFLDDVYYSIDLNEIKVAENQEYVANYGTYYIPYCDSRLFTEKLYLQAYFDKELKLFGFKNVRYKEVHGAIEIIEEIVLKPKYLKATSFSEGLALVMLEKDSAIAIIDENEKVIAVFDKKINYNFDIHSYFGVFVNHCITLESSEIINGENVIKNYIFNTKGEILVEGFDADSILYGESGDC